MTYVPRQAAVNAYPETHQTGFVEIGNRDIIDQLDLQNADFGLQVAPDGRVWVCINGVAFIRFKPAGPRSIDE